MRIRLSLALFSAAACVAGCQRDAMTIRFDAPTGDEIAVGIHAADGRLVRQLAPGDAARTWATGVIWDGLDESGQPVEPGTYQWSAFTHRGFRLTLSGAACVNQPFDPRASRAELKRWSGNGGTPNAVAADGARVYLGWSDGQVAACDLDGHVEWSVALPDGISCRGLAVDGDTVVAIARSRPPFVACDHLVKLHTESGELRPWPAGPTLPITGLWPADAQAQPKLATAMTARNGRIYLTFSELQFLAVLRTDTGTYLQTVVGPPPGPIDVTPTQTEAPDDPGKLIDADFGVVALQGGVLGKVLFSHEPLWVMTSDFQPLDRDEKITALALLGDGAKHHKHSVFVGLGPPFQQVQRRSVLASEGFLWIAGRAGGRAPSGPWDADALGPIHSLALDARGRLWIAEGDGVPPRFSVWNTEGNQGHLEREFFGPVTVEDSGAAVLPSDPEVIVGAGCEWRIDPSGGPARCLGVITRDGMMAAGFRTAGSGELLLHVRHPDHTFSVFERRGEGDYLPREQHAVSGVSAFAPVSRITLQRTGITVDLGQTTPDVWLVGTPDGLRLGAAMPSLGMIIPDLWPTNANGVSSIAQSADGKVYAATADHGLFRVEIGGLDGIRRLPGGKLTVRAGAK